MIHIIKLIKENIFYDQNIKSKYTRDNNKINKSSVLNQYIIKNNSNAFQESSQYNAIDSDCLFKDPNTVELQLQDNTPRKTKKPKQDDFLENDNFKKKFFESHLNEIISWEELQSVASAIDTNDWAYVKYILTIICLMLKSYQNISEEANNQAEETSENTFLSPRVRLNLDNNDDGITGAHPSNLGNNTQGNESLFMPSDYGHKCKSLRFKKEDIHDQLMNLNKLFKKMKRKNINMNISNCWNCQNNMCRIHHLGSSKDKKTFLQTPK